MAGLLKWICCANCVGVCHIQQCPNLGRSYRQREGQQIAEFAHRLERMSSKAGYEVMLNDFLLTNISQIDTNRRSVWKVNQRLSMVKMVMFNELMLFVDYHWNDVTVYDARTNE